MCVVFFHSQKIYFFFLRRARGRGQKTRIQVDSEGWWWWEKEKNPSLPQRAARTAVCMVYGEPTKRRRGGSRKRTHAAYGNEELCSDLCCKAPMYAKHLCRRCYNNTRTKAISAMTCTRTDCGRRRFRRTLCNTHYVEFLHHKSPAVKRCAATKCQKWCARGGTRYCPTHDAVYGDGVRKDEKRHLTPAAILRTAIVTKQMFDLMSPEQMAALSCSRSFVE